MIKLFVSLFAIMQFGIAFSQTTPKGLEVKSKAPIFSAKDQNGKDFNLQKALKKGAVILVFYRGQWCPFCNKQLSQLQDSLPQIEAKGATLVAVSPEQLENITKTVGKTKAVYPILHDEDLKIMKAYDVAFKVDNATIEKYKTYGIDFDNANGNNGASLPVPAVYIIDKKGKIVFKSFDTDYRKRVSVATILANL